MLSVKRSVVMLLMLGFVLLNLVGETRKELIDNLYEEIFVNVESREFDAVDYFPHADGVLVFYFKNKSEVYVKALFFASLYQLQYYVNVTESAIEGYCEKIQYESPYKLEGSVKNYEGDFRFEKNRIKNAGNSFEEKLSFVIMEILKKEF